MSLPRLQGTGSYEALGTTRNATIQWKREFGRSGVGVPTIHEIGALTMGGEARIDWAQLAGDLAVSSRIVARGC